MHKRQKEGIRISKLLILPPFHGFHDRSDLGAEFNIYHHLRLLLSSTRKERFDITRKKKRRREKEMKEKSEIPK